MNNRRFLPRWEGIQGHAMPHRRVLVLGADSLFRDGILLLLQRVEDVSLVGAWEMNWAALHRIASVEPDIVLIVDAGEASGVGMAFAEDLLKHHPTMLVIRVNSHDDVLSIHSARQAPADLATLLHVIRSSWPGGTG